MFTATAFIQELKSLSSPEHAQAMQRYFKTGEGEYAHGDKFIGVRMGDVFALAKKFVEMPLSEIENLLESDLHEARAGAVSIMDFLARKKKTSVELRKELYNLYLRRHDRINNWDLVDRSAIYVVGGYLFEFKNQQAEILYSLAKSSDIWERRTAIIATAYFIKRHKLDHTYKIAEILLKDKHDLIHKAVGWMLRYAGDMDRPRLLKFLDQHLKVMPRTMLRYAIEKLEKPLRQEYLGRPTS
jgi:3-methyladenine DNA glycosylase AlkD